MQEINSHSSYWVYITAPVPCSNNDSIARLVEVQGPFCSILMFHCYMAQKKKEEDIESEGDSMYEMGRWCVGE